MARFFHQLFCRVFRKENTALLAFYYLFGLLFGALCAASFSAESSLMRSFLDSTVSIVWRPIFLILPFLFSLTFVIASMPELLYCVCLLEAFLLPFASVSLFGIGTKCGCLAQMLGLLSDYLSMPALYYFWARHISGDTKLHLGEVIVLLLILVVLGILDYYVFSHFIRSVFLQKG